MLIQRFRNCSQHVMIAIFRAYCICLYGVALWPLFSSCIMMKFKYCYNKCVKKFFGYSKYYSVTEMLLALCLSSFDTVIHNCRKSFLYVWSKHSNDLVKLLRCVSPSAFLWLLLCFIVLFTVFYCTFSLFCPSVCLYVCLCVFVYGPCCLIQIKWWRWYYENTVNVGISCNLCHEKRCYYKWTINRRWVK